MANPRLFKKLYELPNGLLAEARIRLLHGDSAGSVARMLKASGQFVDHSLHLPEGMSKVDAIRELGWMTAHQRPRVDRMLRRPESRSYWRRRGESMETLNFGHKDGVHHFLANSPS